MKNKPVWKLAYFNRLPLKTEKEVKEYMEDLGVGYYDTKIEITIDALNVDENKLNKNHKLYKDIMEAKEKEETHFSFTI